jgi:hypothetical protein
MRLLLIGAIEPLRDRRNESTLGSPKSSQLLIAEIEPPDDRRNEATLQVLGGIPKSISDPNPKIG